MDYTRYVTFRIDQQTFAIDANSVGELTEFNAVSLTRIPNTEPHMVGLVNLRGNVVPVIDFRVMLDLSSSFEKLEGTVSSLELRLDQWNEWLESVKSGQHVTKPGFDAWWTTMVENEWSAREIDWCAAAVRGQLKQLDAIVVLLRSANAELKKGESAEAQSLLKQIATATTSTHRIFERLIASAKRELCPMLIVLRVNNSHVSMLVDEVLAVHEVQELNSLEDIPMLNGLKEMATGSFSLAGEYVVCVDLCSIAPVEMAA